MTRPAKLGPVEARYIVKAVNLRRRLTDKALADRFGISRVTVGKYANQVHKTLGRSGVGW